MSDVPETNLRDENDTFTLIGGSQIEKLDEYVESLSEHGREDIYVEDDRATLDSKFCQVMCSLLALEKYVENLRNQVAVKYRVGTE